MSFTPDLFAFLRDLKHHNNRDWFEKNRSRYQAAVETPMLEFIHQVGERLPATCPGYTADARRVGGSMFRIYRDTRFSPDKSPYKTWMAARFTPRRAKRGTHTPSFYLHLGLEDSFGGGGIYHADLAILTRIRQRIVSHPKAWRAVLESGITLEGDRLKRPPAGYDPKHPFIEDLKRKDLYAFTEFTEAQVTSPKFIDRFMRACADVAPLVGFLTEAVMSRP